MHGHLAQHLRSSEPKGHIPTPRGTWGNFGETRGGVGKNGALEHKSGNISETRTDRGKVTMHGEPIELTFALSNSTIPDPLRPASPSRRLGFAPHPKLQSLLSQERVKIRTSNLAITITVSIRIIAHEKFGEKGAWAYPGTA